MADGSKIEWTDATWNPITGCSVVSPGCTNCYAMRLAGTRMKHHPSRAGLTDDSKAGPVWNGTVRLNEQWLDQPLRWKKPRMIFVCAHGDLFHENVPDEWLDRVFAIMAEVRQHTFQVLTKRSGRMQKYFEQGLLKSRVAALVNDDFDFRDFLWPLPNVWLGVSAEDQERADERIPDLLATPAAIRFVSAEPLLGPIDFFRLDRSDWFDFHTGEKKISYLDALNGFRYHGPYNDNPISAHTSVAKIDQIIVGGESGPRARPMRPDWARPIRDQCATAGTAFFFKQWGEFRPPETDAEWKRFRDGDGYNGSLVLNGSFEDKSGNGLIRVGKAAAGHMLDGREHHEFPTPIQRG